MCNLVTSRAGQKQELDGLSSNLVVVTIYGGEQALHYV
jgi:hypothetical protein